METDVDPVRGPDASPSAQHDNRQIVFHRHIKAKARELMVNSVEGKSDTAPEALAVQYEIYRRMSPARKFQLVLDTYEMGKRLAMAGLRMRHPDATREELWRLWTRQHLGRELSEKVYGVSAHEREA